MWALASLLTTALHAAPLTQLQADTTYDVRPDASYSVEQISRIRVDDAAAVRSVGQMPLSYSSSLETLEVLEAYTTTKGGQRLEVTPDKIIDQQEPQSSQAPLFSDRKVKTVIFPQVEVGSIITARWRRIQKVPDFHGLFAIWESQARALDVQAETVTLRTPATLDMHIDTRDMEGGPVESGTPGIKEWRWSFKPNQGRPREPRAPHPRDDSAYVLVSTFTSYEELARAYETGAAAQRKPTADIRNLADEITAGIKDKRAQAKALYEWVSGNIRYVGIFLGRGGYVPHSAQDILAARYGDCKDHVTLLEALLSAKKIRSSAVLIQASDSYFVPDIVSPRAFNHAITYLPDFDLVVDSTADSLPFGVLGPAEYGKKVLIVDNGHGKSEMRTLPMPKPTADWSVARVDFTLADDGTVTGTTKGEAAGVYEAQDRMALKSIPQDQMDEVINRRLGVRGTGKLEAGNARDLTRPFVYGSTIEMPQYIKLPGPGAFPQPSGVGRFNGTMAQFVQQLSQPTRTMPMVCPGPGKRTEISQLRLPSSLKVTSVPTGIRHTTKFGTYESTYEHKGDLIVSTRTLTLEFREAICSPGDYKELRDLASAIRQDTMAQIIFD
jgi:hypothetical protein